MKPREAAPKLYQVMQDWLAENVEPKYQETTLQHVKCKLFVDLGYDKRNKPTTTEIHHD